MSSRVEQPTAGRSAVAPLALALLLLAATAVACSSPGAGSSVPRRGEPAGSGPAPTTRPTTTRRTTTTHAPTTTATVPPPTTEPEQRGWTPVSYTGKAIAVDERSAVMADGSTVTMFRFRAGRVRFDLHVGSQDPPADLAALPADAQPAVSSAEAPLLLAAFNGGFKARAGAGGFEVDGQTLVPLQSGLASFVVDANGSGHVGLWGQDLPAPGEQVTSVRQNLLPLVLHSQPRPQASDIGLWGSTLGGGAYVARSALGEDAAGNLLYAASMSTVPIDLADALVASGVTTAMELDINPEWVQLACSARPGGALQAGVPGQHRPADQYAVGWTRDFVTVLTAGPPRSGSR